MAMQTCSACQGKGVITDYSQRIQTSPSYYTYGERTCPPCGGTGEIYKHTPSSGATTNTPSTSTSKGKVEKTTTATGDSGVQGIFAFIGFLVGAISVYQGSDDNLIMAGIVGLVTGYVAGKWYKAIITIAIIIGIFYLIGSQN